MSRVGYKLFLPLIAFFQRRDDPSREISRKEKQYDQRSTAENQGVVDQCTSAFQDDGVVQKSHQRIAVFFRHPVDEMLLHTFVSPSLDGRNGEGGQRVLAEGGNVGGVNFQNRAGGFLASSRHNSQDR